MELAKAYDPKEAEQSHYKRWEENGFFAPEINENPDAKPYSIVIPPPNVTGSLHMGHVFGDRALAGLHAARDLPLPEFLFVI